LPQIAGALRDHRPVAGPSERLQGNEPEHAEHANHRYQFLKCECSLFVLGPDSEGGFIGF
jgi:hypothetical protein